MKLRVFCVFLAACGAFAGDVRVVDEIVAKVNGDIVSQDELDRMDRDLLSELKQQGESGVKLEQDYDTHKANTLRDRIDELLLVQKAKELNINVDSDVTKYTTSIQRESGLTDPDKFHEWVREKSGMTYEDFLAETRNSFMQREVITQEVGRKISITDQEIRTYYEAHKSDFVRDEKVFLSEILISTEGKDAAGIAAGEKKAEQISIEASRGERFSDLARDNSDANTAKSGGMLGGYKKGDLSKQIEDAVWTLPKGGVTKPIKLPTGFEILKVEDHTKAGLESMEEAKPEIENILYGPKMQPKVREYLTELRKSAFLQIRPPYVDTGAASGQDTRWQDVAQLKPETVTKAEVEQKVRHKRLLWVIPIPGTKQTVNGTSSSR